MEKHFYCEECKKEVAEPKEKAIEQLLKDFNQHHKDDDVLLCDDCYSRFMKEITN